MSVRGRRVGGWNREAAGARSSGSLDPRSAVLCACPPLRPAVGFVSRAIPEILLRNEYVCMRSCISGQCPVWWDGIVRFDVCVSADVRCVSSVHLAQCSLLLFAVLPALPVCVSVSRHPQYIPYEYLKLLCHVHVTRCFVLSL